MKKILHDNVVHHPLGGGSYVFKKKYVDYIVSQIAKPDIKISIGAQPNGSPHFGTITTFALAFSLAKQLKSQGKNVSIVLELVDTAISEDHSFANTRYQKSLAYTGEINDHIGYYQELLGKLSSYSGISFEIRGQRDFNSHKKIPEIISRLIDKREQIGALLSPESKRLALRVACPECGLADKHGINNYYEGKKINFVCPTHGQKSVNIDEQPQKLEYNTPLRNLLKGIIYAEDNKDKEIPYSWVRVTGSDYAGTYQEQTLYKGASILGTSVNDLPFIVYCPLVTDWSGAKLSKSLYVKGDAYDYLKNQELDYLINYQKFRAKFGVDGLRTLYDEANSWLNEPYKLFRNYSIYYFDGLLRKAKDTELEQPQGSFQAVGKLIDGLIEECLTKQKCLPCLLWEKWQDKKQKQNGTSQKQLQNSNGQQTEALIVHQEPVIFGKKVL